MQNVLIFVAVLVVSSCSSPVLKSPPVIGPEVEKMSMVFVPHAVNQLQANAGGAFVGD